MQDASLIEKTRRHFRVNRWATRRFKFRVRQAGLDDLSNLAGAESEAWKETGAATFGESELRAQLLRYPGGTIGVERTGPSGRGVEAFISLMRISGQTLDRILREPCTWEDITSSGYITSHDPSGEYFYGVNLSVPRRLRALGVGDRLRGAVAFKMVREGVRGIIFESRLPGLRGYNDRRSAAGEERVTGDAYARLEDRRGRPLDPELRDYLSIPTMRMLAVKPGFFQDPESEDWGALLCCPNPIYHFRAGFLYALRPVTNPVIWLVAKVASLAA